MMLHGSWICAAGEHRQMATTTQSADSANTTTTDDTPQRTPLWLFVRRPRVVIVLVASLLLVFSALLHMQVIGSSTGAYSDIYSYNLQAETVFKHLNVYTVTDRYPYPPVWIWIIALAAWFSIHLGVPFDQMAKAPATIGDYAIAIVLLLFAIRRFGWSLFALVPMALFALNPLAVLISAGHGQFDSLVIAFLLLAIYLRGEQQDRRIIWGSLAIGVAIALKGYPVLALPVFVAAAPPGSRLRTTIAAFVPLVVSTVFYCAIFGVSSRMLPNILGYQSTGDFGWGYLMAPYSADAPILALLLGVVSKVLIVLFAVIAPALLLRRHPVLALVMLFSAFYALTYTMSVQYLLWILPFLCLALPLWALVFTVVGMLCAVSFYHRIFPGALPTADPWPAMLAALNAPREVGVIALMVVSAIICIITFILASPYAQTIHAWLPHLRGRSFGYSGIDANIDADDIVESAP